MTATSQLPCRVRKAWQVAVKGYDETSIVFAATAGRARMEVWRSLDCGLRVVDISVRRAAYRDVRLPLPDPITERLSESERDCLLHAFGANCGDPTKAGYRDYFFTRVDDPPLVALFGLGLMSIQLTESRSHEDGMAYFVLTPPGRHAALSLTPEYAR